jgi:hypothetical protein
MEEKMKRIKVKIKNKKNTKNKIKVKPNKLNECSGLFPLLWLRW